MRVWLVSLSIRSTELSIEDMTSMLETEPTGFTRIGDLVSSRSPDGPVRTENVWSLESRVEGGRFRAHFEPLIPCLERIAQNEVLQAQTLILWVAANAFSTGRIVEVGNQEMVILAKANCTMKFDIYNEPAEDDWPDGRMEAFQDALYCATQRLKRALSNVFKN